MYRKGFLIISFVIALFFIVLSAVTLALNTGEKKSPEEISVTIKNVFEAVVDNEKPVVVEEKVIKSSLIAGSGKKIPKFSRHCDDCVHSEAGRSNPYKVFAKKDIGADHILFEGKIKRESAKPKPTSFKKPLVASKDLNVMVIEKKDDDSNIAKKKFPRKRESFYLAGKRTYMPYFQVGGNIFLRGPDRASGSLDLFIPILEWGITDLIFTDLRFYNRSGPAFEGNLNLGYRHLFLNSQQILGIFGAFDRRKTYTGNYFNQVMVGFEYWFKRFFTGFNTYFPIGDSTRHLGDKIGWAPIDDGRESYSGITFTKDRLHEKAIAGWDLEVGYEFIDGLVGYLGGYYFNANRVDGVYGPRARFTYDVFLDSKHVFKIFNKVGIEASVQHDKQRGTVWHFGVNVRMGLWPDRMKDLQGVSRHMVDLVRRDVDIVVGDMNEKDEGSMVVAEAENSEDLYEKLEKRDMDVMVMNYDVTGLKEYEIPKAVPNSPEISIGSFDRGDVARFVGDDRLSVIIEFNVNSGGRTSKISYDIFTKKGYKVVNKREMIYEPDCAKRYGKGSGVRAIRTNRRKEGWYCSRPKKHYSDAIKEFEFYSRNGENFPGI